MGETRDLASVVNLDAGTWARDLASALAGPGAVVMTSGGGSPGGSGTPPILSLLSHPAPVLGVLSGAAVGPAALGLLACDGILWLRGGALLLEPRGEGEVTLLARRMGEAGAARVWFSGGRLGRREALRSGWARAFSGTMREAVAEAARFASGLSPGALALLRPLLNHQEGLGRGPSEALERASFALAFAGRDREEGIRAFLEKRTPGFERS